MPNNIRSTQGHGDLRKKADNPSSPSTSVNFPVGLFIIHFKRDVVVE
jgi:hypothetical protein